MPEFIRRKALSKLWLSSPILANIDGLNDYDEDFTVAGSLVETLQSALSKDDADAVTGDDAAGQAAGEPAQVAVDEPAVESIDEVREGPPDDDTANDGGETYLRKYVTVFLVILHFHETISTNRDVGRSHIRSSLSLYMPSGATGR